MIDTVRFKIRIDYQTYLRMLRVSDVYSKKGYESHVHDYEFFRAEINVGSYSKKISIQLDEPYISIEFSLPKYKYGQNIYLLYPTQIEQTLTDFHKELEHYFGKFPVPREWSIIRLDICYAWKFSDVNHSILALDIARTLNFPQKKRRQYPTGVTFQGRYNTIKFYLKHDEFIYHEKKDSDLKVEELEFLTNFSKGVLRFESTMRKEVFPTYFDKTELSLKDICNQELITTALQRYINTLFKFADKQTMEVEEVRQKIQVVYGIAWTEKLYPFWEYLNSPSTTHQAILSNYSKDKRYRYKKKLQQAGIGLKNTDESFVFDFGIPSPWVVNNETPEDTREIVVRRTQDYISTLDFRGERQGSAV